MKRIASSCVLLALLTGCATNADLENTRQEINQVNQQASSRLTQIETKLSNDKLLDMVSQLDELKAQVAKLSGQIEVMRYDLQTTQKRQNDLYADLDSRLAHLENPNASQPAVQLPASHDASQPGAAQPGSSQAVASQSGASAPVATDAAPAPAPLSDYDKALNMLRNRDFANAITVLDRFIQQNPSDPKSQDATYWLGIAHTALRQCDAAIIIHRRFIQQYPHHPHAPDAMRNIANCQRDLDQLDEAKATLKKLIKLYPHSDAASKAKLLLKSI
jgi:tol-pal system protein YbgF